MTPVNLVLLPGLLNDARLWRHQIDALAGRVRSTVGDLTHADSITALATDVLSRAPERFALAGLSMGGYVAFEILRQAPQRVLGLALLDTTARPDTPEATENRRRRMQIAEKDFQAVIDVQLRNMVHPSRTKDGALVDVINAMAHDLGKDVFFRQQHAIIGRVDSRPLLPQIDCPTLVLCGRQDAITPVAVHEEMAAGIHGTQLVVVEDCGHLSAIEQPEHVTDAMRQWLRRVAP
jgi:pimeloyl-ACP methyl ester carboxylesterase